MATDLREDVFSQILLKKRLKMTKHSNACQNFRITAKALKLLEIICRLMYFSEIKAVTSCSTHKIDQRETDG